MTPPQPSAPPGPLARARARGRGLAVRGLDPIAAAVAGASAVAFVALGLALFHDHVGHAAQALLLVVPVVATAVLGGRRPAQCAAALATLLFLLILPPAGTLRLQSRDDIVALVVFMVVAFAVGGLVAVRVETLGRVERQRAVLLRSVSHDLRTPLAAICAGVAELADESLHSPEARQRLLAVVGEEAQRLDRLVGNLLSMARLEGGGLNLRGAVDPGELVEACVGHLRSRDPRVDVVVDVQPDLPVLYCDHVLLEQAVTNLLENAVRHSPAGEQVDVSVRGTGSAVRLTVSDGGDGVAPEDARSIFEPFRSGPVAGTGGIGLAICEAVVKAHRGSIDVRESPRGGAAFTVVLPLR